MCRLMSFDNEMMRNIMKKTMKKSHPDTLYIASLSLFLFLFPICENIKNNRENIIFLSILFPIKSECKEKCHRKMDEKKNEDI